MTDSQAVKIWNTRAQSTEVERLRSALECIFAHTETGALAPEEEVVDLATSVLSGYGVDERKLAPTIVKWNGGIASVSKIARAALNGEPTESKSDE